MAALCAAGFAGRDAAAQTWVLDAVVEPPVLPDVDPADNMGFGTAVSVGVTTWLVVGAPLADCTTPSGLVVDAGRIFLYKRVGGAWQYQQSFCAEIPTASARYGAAVDMAGGRVIVGAPYTDNFTGGPRGLVEFFKFGTATQTWTRELTQNGTAGGVLGASVSIERDLAIAGEEGVNNQRGRVRSWRLTSTGIVSEATYAPGGLQDGARYGRRVSLYFANCELPACASYTDSMAVMAQNKLYIAQRYNGQWLGMQTFSPALGAGFQNPGAVDMNRERIAVTMNIFSASPFVTCPAGYAVRSFVRTGGSFAFAADECPPPGYNADHFGYALAVERNADRFHVGAPDITALSGTPAPVPAAVSTYQGSPAVYVDSVQDLALAPAPPSSPWTYNDKFGASVSAFNGYMAVGAPWSHTYFGTAGIGYVAIYTD